jgi:hypothetical protein
LKADPQLACLPRGMALIKGKGCIVITTVAVMCWRFGHSIDGRKIATYAAGACLMCGATVLVWALSFIPLAALAFHIGAFAILLTAGSDRKSTTRDTAQVEDIASAIP